MTDRLSPAPQTMTELCALLSEREEELHRIITEQSGEEEDALRKSDEEAALCIGNALMDVLRYLVRRADDLGMPITMRPPVFTFSDDDDDSAPVG